MAFGIIHLATFLAGTVLIILLPGPNSLYVMRVAAARGIAAGYRGALGIFAGDTVLMVLSTAGVARLMRSNASLFLLLKVTGAAYLSWLGWQLLCAGYGLWRESRAPAATTATPMPTAIETETPTPTLAAGQDDLRAFRTAFTISLMNPKAILFFISFFIQFVDPAYPHPALSFLILGVILQICSLTYLSVLIVGGVRLAAAFRARHRLSALATGAVGALFLGFAARLATASL